MSLNYASALSEYNDKGVCGLPEIHDPDDIFEQKVAVLTELLRQSSYTVVHTGAGLSTASGIPDFRGPHGVWTLEKRGQTPTMDRSFEDAIPSQGHMALVALEHAGYINYVITQNIDGLHLRSGFPRNRLSILHGDMFLENCHSCGASYIRSTKPVPTIGIKLTGSRCSKMKTRVRPCGGKLRDSVLDWEDELPEPDYSLAVKEARAARLHLCLGAPFDTLQTARLSFRGSHIGIPRKRKQFHPQVDPNPVIDLTGAPSSQPSTPMACNGGHRESEKSRKRHLIASFNHLVDSGSIVAEDRIDDLIEVLVGGGDSPREDLVMEPPNLGTILGFSRQRRQRFKPTPDRATGRLETETADNIRLTRRKARLHLSLGTSLQIFPAASLPFQKRSGPRRHEAPSDTATRKRKSRGAVIDLTDTGDETCTPPAKNGRGALNIKEKPKKQKVDADSAFEYNVKTVIVNLQPTKFDSRAEMCIRSEIDRVLVRVCENLGLVIPKVERIDKVFIPRIVLRSVHTLEWEHFPWTLLSHPDNAISPITLPLEKKPKVNGDADKVLAFKNGDATDC